MPSLVLLALLASLQAPVPADWIELTEDETGGPLFGVREVQVTSRIWILDARNHRVVGAEHGGNPLILGGRGRGPGEFLVPLNLYAAGDSLVVVWDNSLRRLTHFRRESTGKWAAETAQIATRIRGLDTYGAYPLAGGAAILFNTTTHPFDSKAERISGLVARGRPGASELDTLLVFPLSGAVTYRTESPLIPDGFRFHVTTPYADAAPHMGRSAACGGLFAVSALRDSLEVHFFDRAARRLGKAAAPLQGPATTAEDWESYISAKKPELQRLLEKEVPPARYPPISAPSPDEQRPPLGPAFRSPDGHERVE